MDLENFPAVFFVRHGDLHYLVKPARSEYGRIQDIPTVCRSQHKDPFEVLDPVEFHQELAENPFGNV